MRVRSLQEDEEVAIKDHMAHHSEKHQKDLTLDLLLNMTRKQREEKDWKGIRI